MFGSLDFIYVPTADVAGTARQYVDTIGGELVFLVNGMGTSVACVKVSDDGPAILLSGHLHSEVPVLIYRVDDYATTAADLRANGIDPIEELEIPHGPCASFTMPGGQRIAVYELVRPEANAHFAGRFD